MPKYYSVTLFFHFVWHLSSVEINQLFGTSLSIFSNAFSAFLARAKLCKTSTVPHIKIFVTARLNLPPKIVTTPSLVYWVKFLEHENIPLWFSGTAKQKYFDKKIFTYQKFSKTLAPKIVDIPFLHERFFETPEPKTFVILSNTFCEKYKKIQKREYQLFTFGNALLLKITIILRNTEESPLRNFTALYEKKNYAKNGNTFVWFIRIFMFSQWTVATFSCTWLGN